MPRLGIARLMVFVAYVALNFGVIRALYDGFWEDLLFDALPTMNILVLMSIAGFRRHRMRTFALGFVVIGAASLLALQMWAREYPWTFLRYFQPQCDAVEYRIKAVFPSAYLSVMYGILVLVFAIPHTILGIAGGYLAAKVWGMMRRRRSALGSSQDQNGSASDPAVWQGFL
jgi:hypothetical protein